MFDPDIFEDPAVNEFWARVARVVLWVFLVPCMVPGAIWWFFFRGVS